MNRQGDDALGENEINSEHGVIDDASVAPIQRGGGVGHAVGSDCGDEFLLLRLAQTFPITATATLGKSAATKPRPAFAIANVADLSTLGADDARVLQRWRSGQHHVIFLVQPHHEFDFGIVDARDVLAELSGAQHHR